MLNKRALLGGEMILWFFSFFLLIVIIAGIALIVYSFYSKNIDTREIEASLISNKLAKCIIKDGVLQDISSLSLEKCGLNLNLEENYINITLEGKSASLGNAGFEVYCRLKGIKMPYQPFCLRQKFYALKNSQAAYIDMLVASTKGLT
jgi:hypothetical protein